MQRIKMGIYSDNIKINNRKEKSSYKLKKNDQVVLYNFSFGYCLNSVLSNHQPAVPKYGTAGDGSKTLWIRGGNHPHHDRQGQALLSRLHHQNESRRRERPQF